MTDADQFKTIAAEITNWGRWGHEDQRGTLNFMTPALVVAAAKLIQRGAVFSLSIPVGRDGPQVGNRRANPLHLMTDVHSSIPAGGPMKFSDDLLVMYMQSGTQWDALAHVEYDDQLYNGVASSTVTVQGASRLSIDKLASALVGRGVLLDIARLHGVDWLDAGQVISPEELDEAARRQNVTVSPGDVILLRTGWRRRFVEERSPAKFMAGEPGIGVAAARWLHEHQVGALCADNFAVEAIPGEAGWPPLALHMLLVRDMGMTLGEIFDFEDLAADCQSDGRYDFFFCGPPLRITGGVGSAANPVAIK